QLAQLDQALAQVEGAPLQLGVAGHVVEELVLQAVYLGVQGLHRGEVTVHNVVEQTVQQERDAAAGQGGGVVPPGHHVVDVEPVVGVHGDQGVAGNECVDLMRRQPPGGPIDVDRVSDQEQVLGIVVQFRPLVGVGDVLQRQVVQAEL